MSGEFRGGVLNMVGNQGVGKHAIDLYRMFFRPQSSAEALIRDHDTATFRQEVPLGALELKMGILGPRSKKDSTPSEQIEFPTTLLASTVIVLNDVIAERRRIVGSNDPDLELFDQGIGRFEVLEDDRAVVKLPNSPGEHHPELVDSSLEGPINYVLQRALQKLTSKAS